jgi:hypothetical protein
MQVNELGCFHSFLSIYCRKYTRFICSAGIVADELVMSTDTAREIQRERTTDTGRTESRSGTGRERATVFKSNTGVAVVEATVARLTGGGKFVVQPIGGEVGVEVGDQVIIFILDKSLLGRKALLATQASKHT